MRSICKVAFIFIAVKSVIVTCRTARICGTLILGWFESKYNNKANSNFIILLKNDVEN